jgi:hypothetical protein
LTMALEFRIRGYALMRGPVTRDAGATLAQSRCQSFSVGEVKQPPFRLNEEKIRAVASGQINVCP